MGLRKSIVLQATAGGTSCTTPTAKWFIANSFVLITHAVFAKSVVSVFAMDHQKCETCGKPKAQLQCGLCQAAICKACAQFLEPEAFAFLPKRPEALSFDTYCGPCFDANVTPGLLSYQQSLEQAKNVEVFNKSQSKETRLIKRIAAPVQVQNCPDHDEAVLRLAFLAIEAGYNGIVDLELKSQKHKNGSYQTTTWSGTATPAQVRENSLIKDRSFWQNPN